ncbi:MAG: hypothetical protein KKE02_09115 [Alphaproteobacteria bacterium]|nr:hypothetical protein [Alphaproteobacteria bacterium]MBU1514138.1 hypothetical protein [Alphaproteobacteria bacterium]MBU2096213.1 hypothetical protein [Alphaproteobacteria bacterium]MBU2151167.1 hypothetical protein [Alphaproteobacteria bacterium]MBU2307174.1 hypothetical protein [Alphaproteobacteria bacterium]
MIRRAALLALAIASCVVAPAAAQAVVDTRGREVVQVRTRPDAVGDIYRYRSETRFIQKDDQGGQTQSNTLLFDLEVLGVETDGLRLRYTLREGKLTDSGGASMSAAIDAAVGGSLDFRVGRHGELVAVETWPDYKTRLLARIDAALPADDPIRAIVHERMETAPLDAAREMALGDVMLMSVMEPLGRVPLGVTDLGGQDPTASKATLEFSLVKSGCVLAHSRETSRGASGAGSAVVSKAELSVIDGRILSLEQHKVVRGPGGSQDETVTIKRLSAAPACG